MDARTRGQTSPNLNAQGRKATTERLVCSAPAAGVAAKAECWTLRGKALSYYLVHIINILGLLTAAATTTYQLTPHLYYCHDVASTARCLCHGAFDRARGIHKQRHGRRLANKHAHTAVLSVADFTF